MEKENSEIEYNSDEYQDMSQDERLNWLSHKLFNKNYDKITYVLVTHYIHQQLLDEDKTRTGLYQWQNVFDGVVKYPREIKRYDDYDIVQVNMSTQDVPLVSIVRNALGKDSKTKLVLNNDYTTEMWGLSFPHPEVLYNSVAELPDMVFGTEYYQTTALSLLTKRKCFVIPHPADVKRLKSLPKIPTKDAISTIWRRYDNFSYIPSLAVRDLGYKTRLLGYDKNVDKNTWLTTSLFDEVYGGTNFFDFCDLMRESKVVYDPFTFHSYNRAIVDCAAMGVPVVGSNRTQSINVCYPYTKVDPFDVSSAKKLIEKLCVDDDFRKKVVDYAREHVEVYNHKNSMEKYLMALYEEQMRVDSSDHDEVDLSDTTNRNI